MLGLYLCLMMLHFGVDPKYVNFAGFLNLANNGVTFFFLVIFVVN